MFRALVVVFFIIFHGVNAMAGLSIKSFLEVALPAADLEKSTEFYMLLGYEVIDRQPWGLAVLKRSDSRVILLSQTFFKNPSMGYVTEDLDQVKKEIKALNLEIFEDDSNSVPARITIKDPTGNEISIYQK